MKYDVIVAGGGPGGATCAEFLAKNDVDVILFEKGGNDRYKACAGGLMWHNELDFGPLPPEIIERDVDHLLLHGPTNFVDLQSDSNNSTKIGQLTYRNRLDCYFREQANRSGATVETNSEVLSVTNHEDYVEIEVKSNSHEKRVKADALVIATGVHGNKLHRKLKIDRPLEIQQAIQAEFYLPSHIVEERFGGGVYELFFDSKIASHGYTWIFTKKEGVSVGMCNKTVDISHFQDILKYHPVISQKLSGAKQIEFEGRHIWAAPIPDRILEHIFGDKVLLIGDAAGFIDRFTYEGIWHARMSGKLAAETLVKAKKRSDYTASFLLKYQKKCNRIFEIIKNSQKMHHLVYHSGYMNLFIDTMAKILQDKDLSDRYTKNIQTLLEGLLEPGDEIAQLSIEFQRRLLDALQKKLDKRTFRKINRLVEYAYFIK
ncbi:MAG: NAD(P)/FAD-dependent oxidoreductase [Candidatus Helarchaeota archaeon]|nr:NAD(P)/FAD-dependent oxidoreductase [Candidatus Helarchaeota archaeon]